MKILLRQIQSGRLYAGTGRWTEEPAEALDFQMADRAMDAAWDAALEGVEVVMRFDEPSFEIPLTVVGFGRGA